MTALALDPSKCRVRIHTFAEGLFARLAHDLELECRAVSGTAERTGETTAKARLEIRLADIAVTGVLHKGGSVDASGLSASDKTDALEKMRHDVFHAGPEGVVRVEADLDGSKATVKIIPPNGSAVTRRVDVKVGGDAAAPSVTGRLELSLSALGSSPVKGPMNAFRVKDSVEIHFDVAFTAKD